MIRAWRIDKAKRSPADSFSGEGARRIEGRWNSARHAVVYTASSLSLAALEKFVHLGAESLGIRFVSYQVDIPSSVRIMEWKRSEMPKDWRTQPAPISTQKMGDEWIAGLRGAVLIVPSVVIPSESNVLLNPRHPKFTKIKISPPLAFNFDPRMWK